ncbi:MAG: hypothetical protein IPK16_17415 [Anaerolineales bacterium]|nr:hypothetical protein [Anaerolineales bacterium]
MAQNAQPNGTNIALGLADAATVKFYYDHKSHWVADNVNKIIATVPGSFQSEIGCSGDWQADCLRSWLQDTDGDGVYTFSTTAIPAGNYEGKVAINEGWDLNYGQGGAVGGANYAFTVANSGDKVDFSWDSTSKVLSITAAAPPPPPASPVALVGSLQDEAGCAGDWDPACAASELPQDATDGIYQKAFDLPAGDFEYKVALNDSWDLNYGAGAAQNGANIPLSLAAAANVKFYFDPVSHWVTSNKTAAIATAVGSFQGEVGCPGDWQPDCLKSWLQDIDGDGVYVYSTTALPAGA